MKKNITCLKMSVLISAVSMISSTWADSTVRLDGSFMFGEYISGETIKRSVDVKNWGSDSTEIGAITPLNGYIAEADKGIVVHPGQSKSVNIYAPLNTHNTPVDHGDVYTFPTYLNSIEGYHRRR